jgi:ABC-type transport system involved in resistance to organic solvents, ATPase component
VSASPVLPSAESAHVYESHAVLSVQHLGVAFGTRVILADVDFELEAGGLHVLMGPMGTGKSTLLRSLAGLNRRSTRFAGWGKVVCLGRQLAPHEWGSDERLQLVQQQPRFLMLTVLEVLAEALRAQHGPLTPAQTAEQSEQLLRELDQTALLAHLRRRVVDLDTSLQRAVAILAAAARRPKILMIDEPATGLSDYDAHGLFDLIRRLRADATVMVVLHNLRHARSLATHMMLLAGGRIQASCSVDEFFDRPPNAVVRQFVTTGSCHLPAPDADPSTLADDATPPPPLPEAALHAIAAARRQDEEAAAAPPAPAAAAAPPPAVATPAPAPAVPAPPVRRYKVLQTNNGFELANSIAATALPSSLAPRGFSWVVPGRLAGCPMPGAVADIDYDLAALKRVGITKLITLTERDLDQAALRRHGLTNLHLPIRDREPPTVAQTHMLLTHMQRLLDKGESLAVHCLAGLGRTGTVLAAWLIREGGLAADEALKRIRRIDPAFVQSQEQEQFLFAYEQALTQQLL